MADFSKPGSAGELPADYDEWQRAVVYTVRPHMLSPLLRGRTHQITVRVVRRVSTGEARTGYVPLYERADRILKARIAELTCAKEGAPLHSWVQSQEWFRLGQSAQAFITIGLLYPMPGEETSQGADVPTPEALDIPSLDPERMTAEKRTTHATATMAPWDEIYADTDVRDPAVTTPAVALFSSAESVSTCQGVDFRPFVERAEKRARCHHDLFDHGARSATGHFKIVRRHWWTVTHPDIVVVHVYYCAS